MKWREILMRLVAVDPGHLRLRNAMIGTLGAGAAAWAIVVFVRVTGTLQASTAGRHGGQAVAVRAANHDLLVAGILLGSIVAVTSTYSVNDSSPRGQLVSMVIVPLPLVASLAIGLALGSHRFAALTSMVLLLVLATYLRRLGARAFSFGMLVFIGDFLGIFLYPAVTLSAWDGLAAEIAVGTLAAAVVRFSLFYPDSAKALARVRRTYGARARLLAAAVVELLREPTPRAARRVRGQLRRMNEAALLIDAHLGAPHVASPESVLRIHRRLFDIELALSGAARFSEVVARQPALASYGKKASAVLQAVAGRDAPAAVEAVAAFKAYVQEHPVAVRGDDDRSDILVVYRLADALDQLVAALEAWQPQPGPDGQGLEVGNRGSGSGAFHPAVALTNGWLPGASQIANDASRTHVGASGGVALPLYARWAVQMGVASAGAIMLGDMLSPLRYYWAVLAVLITFFGTNNALEQSRKALSRLLGTAIGIVLSALILQVGGTGTPLALIEIFSALFLGLYFMRVNYIFMVLAITLVVSQLYAQLDEYSVGLLLLRLEETAVGAAVAIATVVLVLPLRPRRVLESAIHAVLAALVTLLEDATALLAIPGGGAIHGDVRDRVRALDSAAQALFATTLPMQRSVWGRRRRQVDQLVDSISEARHCARSLVRDVELAHPVEPEMRVDVIRAGQALRSSLEVLRNAVSNQSSHKPFTVPALEASIVVSLLDIDRRLENDRGVGDPAARTIVDYVDMDQALQRLACALAGSGPCRATEAMSATTA